MNKIIFNAMVCCGNLLLCNLNWAFGERIQSVDSFVANPALWLRSKHAVPPWDDADLFL